MGVVQKMSSFFQRIFNPGPIANFILHFGWYLGFFPATYKPPVWEVKYIHIGPVITIFWLTLNSVLVYNYIGYHEMSNETMSQAGTLLSDIQDRFIYMANFTCGVTIRGVLALQVRHIAKLTRSLAKLSRDPHFDWTEQTDSTRSVYVFIAIVVSFHHYIIEISDIVTWYCAEFSKTQFSEIDYTLIAGFLADSIEPLTLGYILIFVVAFGLNVLEAQRELHESIGIVLARNCKMGASTMLHTAHEVHNAFAIVSTRATTESIVQRFKEVQQMFKEYNAVMAPYIGCLLAKATIYITLLLSLPLLGADSSYQNFGKGESAVLVAMIIFLANFGHFLHEQLDESKHQLKQQLVLQGYPHALLTIVDFPWKVKGFHTIKVDYSILPAVAGTVMTYLIVLLQLNVASHTMEQHPNSD